MNTNSSKRNKDSSSEKDIQDSFTGSVTDVGDTSRDMRDTTDVARASIAKGRIRGGDPGSKKVSTTTADDIARGQIETDESVIQGATATPNTAMEDDDNNISRDKVLVLHLMKIKVLIKQTSIPQ
jgi:hypothetical protein